MSKNFRTTNSKFIDQTSRISFKFDGKKTRRLNLIEISQIAGRAGRFKNDGGFGTTGDCESLDSDEIENIEKHQLPETKIIYWRNSKLNFDNPDKLIASLEQKPIKKNLLRTNDLPT